MKTGKPLTKEEILMVLREAKMCGTRDHAAILLTYQHALRAGEVCGIKIGGLDMEKNIVPMLRLLDHTGSLTARSFPVENTGDLVA